MDAGPRQDATHVVLEPTIGLMPLSSTSGQTPSVPTSVPSVGAPSSSPPHDAADGSPSPHSPPQSAQTPSPPQTFTTAAPPPAPDTATAGAIATTTQVQQNTETEQTLRNLAILDALAAGKSYRQIATEHKVSIATLSAIAKRQAELEKQGFAKLMMLKGLQMLEHWEQAAETGARTGKHAPARDWLLHAGAIEPLQSERPPEAKVTVVIGMPGQPVGLPDLQVLDAQTVSGNNDEQG